MVADCRKTRKPVTDSGQSRWELATLESCPDRKTKFIARCDTDTSYSKHTPDLPRHNSVAARITELA
jgi:hypothetical protein